MGEVGVQTYLVAFLLACIEEDEQTARDEQERRDAWHAELDAMMRRGQVPSLAINEYNNPGAPGDPARVLVECDTKRRIIEMFPEGAPKVDGLGNFEGFTARDCGEHRTVGGRAWCHDCGEWCYPHSPCVRCHGVSDVLREMAVVYRDRPGYVEAWAPDGR